MADLPEVHKIEVEATVAAEDADQLRFALGLASHANIEGFLKALAQTGFEMLLDEILGRTDYPTKSAARQARLFKLVRHAFNDTMPSPAVIAALFHITPQAAATLSASTSARYARPLAGATANSVRGALTNKLEIRKAEKTADDNMYRFRCPDGGVIRAIKATLAASSRTVRPITADPAAVNVYEIHASAVEVLSETFGLSREDMLTRDALIKVQKQKQC